MSVQPELVLRDIHQPPAPPWWPPAPGWWLLMALLALAGIAWWAWAARRRRRREAIARLFDEAIAEAATPAQRIAAMSELLRRASRRVRADADRLEGDAWLRFLDEGLPQPVFAAGAGAVLRDGGYRRDVGELEVAALRRVARDRYIRWMERAQ